MRLAKHETSSIFVEVTESFVDKINVVTTKTPVTKQGFAFRLLGTVLTFFGSGLITYRAINNGALSFYGTFCRLLSFFVLGLVFLQDKRLEFSERLMYSVPKLFGFLLSLFQLYGIVHTRKDALTSL